MKKRIAGSAVVLLLTTAQESSAQGRSPFAGVDVAPSGFHIALVGDWDSDGHADALWGNGNEIPVTALGKGDGTFQAPREVPEISTPALFGRGLIRAADLNEDGFPDLVASNTPGERLEVNLGSGDGTFQPPSFIDMSATGQPDHIAVGDLNSDSHVDLVASLPLSPGPSEIHVFLGRGDGTFMAPIVTPTMPALGSSGGILVASLTGDPWPDVLVQYSHQGLYLLRGAGNGGLGPPQQLIDGGGIGLYFTVDDLDADGDSDVAAAQDGIVTTLHNLGGGLLDKVTHSAPLPFPRDLRGIAVAELDEDPDAEILVQTRHSLWFFGGSITQGYEPYLEFSTPSSYGQLGFFADTDGDGAKDLFLESTLLLGRGDGTFPYPTWRSTNVGRDVEILDFNGDGLLDRVGGITSGVRVSLAVSPQDPGGAQDYGLGGDRQDGISMADMDRDGVMDVVASSGKKKSPPTTPDRVYVLLGDGQGGLGPATGFDLGKQPKGIDAGDLDGDGYPDAAVAEPFGGGSTLATLFNQGDGTLGDLTRQPSMTIAPAGTEFVELADLDLDGDLDAALPQAFMGKLSLFWNDGVGVLGGLQELAVAASPRAVASTDLDGNGWPDLAVCHGGTPEVAVLFNQGSGSFAPAVLVPAAEADRVTLGDVDLDGTVDLLVGSEDGVTLNLGLPGGSFEPPLDYEFDGRAIALGDFDKDGYPDLVTADEIYPNLIPERILEPSARSLSVAQGGGVDLQLDLGENFAGRMYWVLGTTAGIVPGLTTSDGLVLPLNPDPNVQYFYKTLVQPNGTVLRQSLGILDLVGRATARFELPSAVHMTSVGLRLRHAVVVFSSFPHDTMVIGRPAPTLLVP